MNIEKIIQNISLHFKTISKVTSTDENELYAFVTKYKDDYYCFENNWSYILQATRNNGYKYKNGDTIVYFYLRQTKEAIEFVIVNYIGKNSFKVIHSLADYVKSELHIITTIKNVNISEVHELESFGFKESTVAWSKYSFRDDNSFPQFISQIKPFVDLDFKATNATTRKIIRRFIKSRIITVRPYEKTMEHDAIILLKNYSTYLSSKGVDYEQEIFKANELIVNEHIKNKIRLAHLENNKLIAVSLLTNFKNILFYNSLVNVNESDIMRYLIWQSLDYICRNYHDTFTELALQGSENEGQNQWKTFFKPIKTVYKTHMVYM